MKARLAAAPALLVALLSATGCCCVKDNPATGFSTAPTVETTAPKPQQTIQPTDRTEPTTMMPVPDEGPGDGAEPVEGQ